MYSATLVLALFFPIVAVASPLAWDGAPAYSGASNSVNGGSATGGGGMNLIKILDHNGAPAGTTQSGDSEGGKGGNRFTSGLPAGLGSGLLGRASTAATAGGSGGGAAYSGASGTAEGGGSETDPEFSILSILSDSAAPGGYSGTGGALGGTAGSIL